MTEGGKGQAAPKTFDYEAAVQAALARFGLGCYTVRVKLDRGISACALSFVKYEYLEAVMKFNPPRIAREGRDPAAVVEHEVMHLALFPLCDFFRRTLRRYELDEAKRERIEEEVDLFEHHALETLHRGFTPEARQWNGTGV